MKTLLLLTGELEENCYLLWREGSAEAVVFDPGAEGPRIERELQARGLTPAAFVQTHCHFDHIGALTFLKQRYPAAPLFVPEAEASWLERPTLNLSYFFGAPVTAPKADVLVRAGEPVSVAGFTLKTLLVPGHSPGSTCYFVEEGAETPHVFCGDTLFRDGIGRTDLPGGDGEDVLVEAIRTELFSLPVETIVHPGHGAETTIGREIAGNPFLQ